MHSFRLSAKAMEDLKSIGRYTGQIWGRTQRNKYLFMLDASFNTIARHPEIGLACDHIRLGYHKYRAGRHLIFYRKKGKYIEIIRVLHDSMDIESHF